MSDTNFMVTFTNMYSYVSSSIDSAVSGFGNGLVSWVAAPLGVAATIYFLLLGYAVLRGAIQAPLRELVWQAGKVGLCIVAAGSVGYSTLVVNTVTNLPDQIISAGSGTEISNAGTTFDNYVSDTSKLAAKFDTANAKVQSEDATILNVTANIKKLRCYLIYYICIAVLFVFAAVSAAVGFCIVIFAKLSVSICVALAPLALACLLFPSSRFIFDGWLRQTANYVLLMVIMAIMTKFITGLEQSVFDSLINLATDDKFISTSSDGYDLNAAAFELATLSAVLIYIVGTIFFFQSPSIASGIAGGASSGGHAFLQTGMNMMANKLMFGRRLSGGNQNQGSGGTAARSGGNSSGGSARRAG